MALNNFNDAQAIIAALHSASVFRLKKTLAKVSEKYHKVLAEISKLLNGENNFKIYRDKLKTLVSPFDHQSFLFVGNLKH
jgi:Trk K+ transport system NAD-binding subunit